MNETDACIAILYAEVLRTEDSVWRRLLLTRLEEWVDTLAPHFSEASALEAIRCIQGTPLEPFVLEPGDDTLSVLFLRAAFSDAVEATRARIVSRETIGNRGGATFTNHLRGFYAERYALGTHRIRRSTGWYFAPAEAEQSLREQPTPAAVTATLSITEKGPLLEVALENPWNLGPVEKNSHVLRTNQSFDALGLSIRIQGKSALIQPGASEAIIRFLGLCARNDTLVLQSERKNENFHGIYIRLRPPGNSSVRLSAFPIVSDSIFRRWIHTELPDKVQEPSLTLEERERLIRAYPLPESWAPHIEKVLK